MSDLAHYRGDFRSAKRRARRKRICFVPSFVSSSLLFDFTLSYILYPRSRNVSYSLCKSLPYWAHYLFELRTFFNFEIFPT